MKKWAPILGSALSSLVFFDIVAGADGVSPRPLPNEITPAVIQNIESNKKVIKVRGCRDKPISWKPDPRDKTKGCKRL